MAEFKVAEKYVLVNEGGYVNDPDDSGGETYRGISRKNFPGWSGWEIVDGHKPLRHGEFINSKILDAQVNTFYKVNFWDKMKGDQISNQNVASYFYDFFVTSGGNAVIELQKVLGIDPQTPNFGPLTLSKVNAYEGNLLLMLHDARTEYYERIGTGKNAKFLKGWLARASKMYQYFI